MPSTYTVNLGIEKPATGEQSGTWGDTTNTNFDILDQGINGAVRVTLSSAGSSGSPNALQITNGAASDGRNKWIEFYSSGDLGGSAYVQLDPNDAEKIVFVRNSLASSRSVILFQGTYNAARDLEVPAGVDMVVKFDGGGASAATVTDVYTNLRVTALTTPSLTATTADINGGTVDNAVIGGSTPAALTATTIVANTSLNIAGDGATVTGIKDEDNMSSNSATKLATQQSIKAYVDSQVGTVDTLAEILANGNTSGSNNLIINNGQALTSNTINETTAGSGVTIDSVLLKDDVVNATDVETGSISANDGTASATIANSTGNFTITNFISNSVDIGGGSIDGTVIGGSVLAAGSFTSLTSTSSNIIAGTGTDAIQTMRVGSGSGGANKASINFQNSASSEIFSLDFDNSTGTLDIRSDLTGNIAQFGRSGGIVFNQDSNDYDFRVESNGNANMLFVDAGNDAVGIGTNSITGLMELNKTSSGNTLQMLSLVNPVGAADTGVQLWLSGTNATTRGTTIEAVAQTTANNHHLIFSTSVGGAAPSEKMRLFDTGKVRLGNSSDHVMVDVTASNAALQLIDNNQSNPPTLRGNGPNFTIENGGLEMMRISSTSETVFNEASQNIDFRVESDGNANMIFVDAANDYVSIATTDDYGKNLNVDGGLEVRGTGDTIELQQSSTGSATYYAMDNTVETGGKRYRFGYTGGTADKGSWSVYNQTDDILNLVLSDDANVFNEDSKDVDFRIESDANSHFLFVDAGNARLGIGTSAPTGSVHLKDITDSDGSDVFYVAQNTTSNRIGGYKVLDESGNITTKIQYDNGGNTASLNLQVPSAGNADINFNGTTFGINANSSSATLQLQTNSTARVDFKASTEVAFNDLGNDYDFRVESNDRTHMFFVDAGNNKAEFSGQVNIWNGANTGDVGGISITPSQTQTTILNNSPGAYGDYGQTYKTMRATGGSAYIRNFDMTYGGSVFNEDSADIDFRVESDDQANMFFIDGNENRIGICTNSNVSEARVQIDVATTSPNASSRTANSALMVNGGTSTVGEGPVIALRNISGSKESITMLCTETVSGNNGDFTVSVYNGGATIDEKIRVLAAGGLTFNGDTAAANALDDYEEGTWTPAFGAETSNPTIGYNAQVGHYTKVGRKVNVNGYIITTSRSGGSGTLTVDGLPFTVASGIAYFSATIGFNYNWNTPPLNAGAQGGTTHILLYQDARTNAVSGSADIVASGNTYFYFNCTYYV